MSKRPARGCGCARVALACAASLLLIGAPRAQTPPQGAGPGGQTPPANGFILGRVVDGATGQPIAEAVVSTNLRPQAPVPNMGGPPGRPGGPPQLRVLTGLDGRFLFRDLPAGQYAITASAPGYLNGASGQTRPGGVSRPIVLEQDQRVADAVVRLWRAASIAGTVVDEDDEPVAGVQVQPLRLDWLAGRRQFNPGGPSRTDDRGRFRIAGLQPGEYVLVVPFSYITAPAALVTGMYENVATGRDITNMMNMARSGVPMPNADSIRVGNYQVGLAAAALSSVIILPPGPDGVLHTYVTTFHPGGLEAAAGGNLALRSGEDRTDVGVRLERVAAARIDGQVFRANGEPAAGVGVRLLRTDVQSLGPPATAMTDADGSFALVGLAPGQYVVRAEERAAPPMPAGQPVNPMMQMMLASAPAESLLAEAPVTATPGGLTPVRLTLRPGARIRGRLRFEGTTAPPVAEQLRSFTITAAPVDNVTPLPTGAPRGRGPGQVQPDGSFETQALAPGRYLVISNPMAPWRLESAMVNGRDATVEPVDVQGDDVTDVVVTLTDATAAVSGSVRDRAGETARDAVVFIFPADYRRWIERGMTGNADVRASAPNGTYNFQRLRPGDYFVAAVIDADLADRNDPQFIERIAPLATPVSLSPGAPQAVDLVVVRVPR